MSLRLPELFNSLLSDFPGRESNNAYLNCLQHIAEAFPLLLSGCIEYHLGEGEGRLDLNINIGYEMNEHKLSLDEKLLEELIVDDKLNTSFRPILNFLNAWKRDDFPLSPFIDFVWLVFDILNPDKKEILPWFYVMFHSNKLTLDPEIKVELIKKTLEKLDCMPQNWADIENTYFSFPSGTTIRSIGIRPAYNRNSIRTFVFAQQMEDIFSLLQKSHWSGDLEKLKSAMHPFSQFYYKCALSVDVGSALSSKIGIELYPREKYFLKLLELLKELKLCSSNAVDDFLQWPGKVKIQVKDTDYPWPDAYRRQVIQSDGMVEITRTVQVVKIIYEQGQPLSAKVYLYYNANQNIFQGENMSESF